MPAISSNHLQSEGCSSSSSQSDAREGARASDSKAFFKTTAGQRSASEPRNQELAARNLGFAQQLDPRGLPYAESSVSHPQTRQSWCPDQGAGAILREDQQSRSNEEAVPGAYSDNPELSDRLEDMRKLKEQEDYIQQLKQQIQMEKDRMAAHLRTQTMGYDAHHQEPDGHVHESLQQPQDFTRAAGIHPPSQVAKAPAQASQGIHLTSQGMQGRRPMGPPPGVHLPQQLPSKVLAPHPGVHGPAQSKQTLAPPSTSRTSTGEVQYAPQSSPTPPTTPGGHFPHPFLQGSTDLESLVRSIHKETGADIAELEELASSGILSLIPRSAEGELASVGSIRHPADCSPCLFWFKNACPRSVSCTYCHFRHLGQRSKRIRPSKRTRVLLGAPEAWELTPEVEPI
ncbi:unnamed protein product [Polarella glacialis]|uniref:C3H1-type domain-containing protein n=1 Tax=Polarella glacialis TaxID=89957 RepID=A0A813H5V2_POLGL|nr:unnamed protein product [Polarella glacialis]